MALIPPLPNRRPNLPFQRIGQQPLPAPPVQYQQGNGSAVSHLFPGSALDRMVGSGPLGVSPDFSMPMPKFATRGSLYAPSVQQAPAPGTFPSQPGAGLAPLPATPFAMRSPDQIYPENRQAFQSLQQSAKTFSGMGTPVSQMQTADQLIAQGAPMYDPNQRALIGRAQNMGQNSTALEQARARGLAEAQAARMGMTPEQLASQQSLQARTAEMQQGPYAPGSVVGENRTQVEAGRNGGVKLVGTGNRGYATDQTLRQNGVDPTAMSDPEKEAALSQIQTQLKQFNKSLKFAQRQDRQAGRAGDPAGMENTLIAMGPQGYAKMLQARASQMGGAPTQGTASAAPVPTSISAAQQHKLEALGEPDKEGNYANANSTLKSFGLAKENVNRYEYGKALEKILNMGGNNQKEFGDVVSMLVSQSMLPENDIYRNNPGGFRNHEYNKWDTLAFGIQSGTIPHTVDAARKWLKEYPGGLAADEGKWSYFGNVNSF